MLALEDWDSRLPAHTHTLRAYRHNLKTIPKGAPSGQLMRNRRVTRRGQISNEKSASVGRNPIPAIAEHPQRDKPDVEAKGRVLKDRPYLDAKLLAARVALPPFLSPQPVVIALSLSGVAVRTYGTAILPPHHGNRVDAGLKVCIMADGFSEGTRLSLGFHVSNDMLERSCSQDLN